MIPTNGKILLDLNNLIFKYNEVTLTDFFLFISSQNIEEIQILYLLYFLILKNDRIFWNMVNKKIIFDIKTENYILQLNILKTYQPLHILASKNLNNSIKISGLDFGNPKIKQFFFDFSVLLNYNNDFLFFEKKTNIYSVILSSSPLEKYNSLKNKLTKAQNKQLFLATFQNFRTSSLFILNDFIILFPEFFSKRIVLNYLNILSQCNKEVQDYLFSFLIQYLTPKNLNSAFKIGVNLSYTSFDYNTLFSFFENLSVKNAKLFSVMACGFISNPQGNKVEVCNYLIKKLYFIEFTKKFGKHLETRNIIIKI